MSRVLSGAVLLFLLIAGRASAAGPIVVDVLGWQNTRWGMTEDEVAVAAGEGVVRVTPPKKYFKSYAPLTLPLLIGAYRFQAVFQFSDQARRLEQVLLQSSGAEPEKLMLLLDLLTQKYGPPKRRGKDFRWVFKTTVIELHQAADVLSLTSVRYYPRSGETEDEDEKKL